MMTKSSRTTFSIIVVSNKMFFFPQVYSNPCLINLSSTFANLHEHIREKNCPTVSVEMLRDENPERHVPLMTYASIKFRKLIDRLSTEERNIQRLRDTYFEANTPPESETQGCLVPEATESADSGGSVPGGPQGSTESKGSTRARARFPVAKRPSSGGRRPAELLLMPTEHGFTAPVVMSFERDGSAATIVEGLFLHERSLVDSRSFTDR